MAWEATPFIIFSLISAVVLAVIAILIYRRGRVPKAREVAALLISGSALWILTAALESGSTIFSAKLFWNQVKFAATLFVPTAWFVFFTRFSGRDQWLTRSRQFLLGVPPLVLLIAGLSNDSHYQFWSSIAKDPMAPTAMLIKAPGPIYWIYLTYSYLMVGLGLFLLVRMLVVSSRLNMWKGVAVLASVLMTWFVDILGNLGVFRMVHYDPTTILLAFSTPVVVWGVWQLRPGSIVREARGAIIQSLSDGVIVLDPQDRVVYLNKSAEHLLDQTAVEAIGRSVEQIWPDLPDLIASLPDNAEEENEVALNRDEEELTYDVRISPLKDWQGQLVSRVIVLRDISERKQAEAKILESEARYRLLAENSIDLITRHTPHGNYLYAAPACEAVLGYQPEELIDRGVYDFIHPDDKEAVLRAHIKVLSEPNVHTISYRHCRKDGEYIWVETASRTIYAPSKDGGGPTEIISVLRDITERKRTEEALLAERERLAVTLQSIADGVVALDSERKVVLANPVAQSHLGSLAGAGVGDILNHLGDTALGVLLAPPPQGKNSHEVMLLMPHPRTFEVVAQPMGAGSQSGGWVLVIRDVTTNRETQQRIHLQERLAAVGQLAAGIAHDFNNILGAIVLFSEMVLQTPDLKPKNRDRLITIFQQAERASLLTRQILDFSRKTVMDQVTLDLGSFLEETEQLLSRTLRENIKLTLEFNEDSYCVNADPTRIQQVLMNLALNASDAMPEGGELRFELSHLHIEPDQPPPYRDMPPGAWVRLRVQDNGKGISPEIKDHIFEPFYTTKDPGEGSGLGLAQVYGIVKQHGGYIDVESQVGEGTTFIIYLPVLEIKVEYSDTQPVAIAANGRNEVILVVEDDKTTLDALQEILEALNYQVLTATDGREALSLMELKNGGVDLVLSDLVMPEMGGVAMYQELEKREIQTKMVFMTGYPLGTGTRELLDKKKVTWVQKPLRSDTLGKVIRNTLDGEKVKV